MKFMAYFLNTKYCVAFARLVGYLSLNQQTLISI